MKIVIAIIEGLIALLKQWGDALAAYLAGLRAARSESVEKELERARRANEIDVLVRHAGDDDLARWLRYPDD